MTDRTEEALARLREARQTFADVMVAGSNIAPRDLNRARVVRSESFDALIAVVAAAIGLKRAAAVHYKPSATASDLTLMSVEAFHRGLAIDAAEERFAAALASLSAAVLGEEASRGTNDAY